jgi:hypothetical protein
MIESFLHPSLRSSYLFSTCWFEWVFSASLTASVLGHLHLAGVVGMQQIERRPRIATLPNAQPSVHSRRMQDERETISSLAKGGSRKLQVRTVVLSLSKDLHLADCLGGKRELTRSFHSISQKHFPHQIGTASAHSHREDVPRTYAVPPETTPCSNASSC